MGPHRDDGLAFIEFVATSEPYYLRIQAKDSLNEGSATYFGPYTVDLDRIVNTTRKVSNTDSTPRHHSGQQHALESHRFHHRLSRRQLQAVILGAGLHHDPDNKATNLVLAQLWSNENGYPSIKLFDFQRIGPITGHPTAQLSDVSGLRATPRSSLPNTISSGIRDANSGSSYHVATVPRRRREPRSRAG